MRIFLRTFNNKINSKTGTQLPLGQYRGTPEWIKFQEILIDCIHSLGHQTFEQLESGLNYEDQPFPCNESLGLADKTVYVHRCKRDKPYGDLFWQQMHMRELFTIDTNGWGADHSGNNLFNSQEINQDEARNFCEAKSIQLQTSGLSKCEQPRDTSETPERFILVPVQIPRDYTIKHHSPITVRYFIESIQAWAIEKEINVCFKMHPHNKSDVDLIKIVEEAAASSPYVRKVTGNIHELIKRSSGVLVINSGTGFEAILHGKPVATIGDCDYRGATLNADIRRLDEVSDFFRLYSEVERALAYKYVYWYFTKHAYDVNREDTKQRLMQYLKENL